MFEKLQGINPMGLSAFLADCEKKYSTNMKIPPTTLRWNTKNTRYLPYVTFYPWSDLFFHNWNIHKA